MSENILDGRLVAAGIFDKIKKEVAELKEKPCLAVVLVGEDPASQVYVSMKQRRCEENGLRSIVHRIPAETTEEQLLSMIEDMNSDRTIHGILVQLPLPDHISEEAIIEAINPHKDVDCFHPFNIGRLVSGNPLFLPCTPAGVMAILEHYNISLSGKRAVVVGRSNIVGKPLAQLLLAQHATVTICHSRTQDLAVEAASADILVAAIGRPSFITADMVKEGAVVVDVGINRVEDSSKERGYSLVGDVDYDAVKDKCSYITPVPGGVGAMTIAMLLQNCLFAYKLLNESN